MDDRSSTHQIAYERSEKRLDLQISFAVASDQRALVLSGVGIAAAALISDVRSFGGSHFHLISVVFFVLSSILSVLSALPQKMSGGGGEFSDMQEALDTKFSMESILSKLGRINDAHIQENDRKAKTRLLAYRLSILAFLVASICFLIAQFQLTEVSRIPK